MMKPLVILSLFTFFSCQEPFGVDSLFYQQTLVVEGMITNEYKNHLIKLSYSSPVDTTGIIPESGAEIRLTSGDGMQYTYLETDKVGTYASPPFSGQSGQSYTLSIQTAAGQRFRSQTVIQKPVAEIESLTAEFIRNDANLDGVEIYVNTLTAGPAISKYYKWEWIETYERRVPFPSEIIWTGRNSTANRTEQVSSCWKFNRSETIYIKSSDGLSENRITNYPVKFIPNGRPELSNRYSLLVRQYSLDINAFTYWKTINELLSNQGSLFDIQSGNLPGNILSESQQPVLGYFDASDVFEYRVFLIPDHFIEQGLTTPSTLDFCNIEEVSPENLGDFMVQNQMTHVIHKAIEADPDDPEKLTGWAMVKNVCGDCREFGITNVKPEFW